MQNIQCMMGYLERIEMPRNMKAASIVNEAYCVEQ